MSYLRITGTWYLTDSGLLQELRILTLRESATTNPRPLFQCEQSLNSNLNSGSLGHQSTILSICWLSK